MIVGIYQIGQDIYPEYYTTSWQDVADELLKKSYGMSYDELKNF